MMKPLKLTVALAMAGMGFGALPLCAAPLASAPPAAEHDARPAAGDLSAPVIRVAETRPAAVPTAPAGQGTHDAAAPGGNIVDEHAVHFPPFDTTTFPSQLLWLVISFGLLYLLMSKVTLPRIGRILEERHDRIADDLEEATKHKLESEAAQAAYEKALTEARAKANTIAGETRSRLAADSEANRKALEADLSAKLAAAEQRIATTKSEALTHVRGIAVDTAGTIVSKLIGESPASAAVEQAVDGALAAQKAA